MPATGNLKASQSVPDLTTRDGTSRSSCLLQPDQKYLTLRAKIQALGLDAPLPIRTVSERMLVGPPEYEFPAIFPEDKMDPAELTPVSEDSASLIIQFLERKLERHSEKMLRSIKTALEPHRKYAIEAHSHLVQMVHDQNAVHQRLNTLTQCTKTILEESVDGCSRER